MKIYLTILLLIFSNSIFSQTSVYHPFPDSGIIWYQMTYNQGVFCCCSGPGPCLQRDDFQYILSNDTILGTSTYKKILKTGVGKLYILESVPVTCPPWCSSNYQYNYYGDLYVGGIRQDTVQRKIFFIPVGAVQDTLLYDFNLYVGDTLPSTWTNQYPSHFVSSIDSIIIGSNYHKRFGISNDNDSNYFSMIEGIGSSQGLLAPFRSNINVSNYYDMLLCVSINGMSVYPDSSTQCSFISDVNVIDNNSEYSIFPNPFSDKLNIKMNGVAKFEIILYDMASRKLLQQSFTNSTTVNTSQLEKGIYVYVMKSINGWIKKGIVIKE